MAGPATAGRGILVFADGTANEGSLLPDENRTNVYKLFRATRVAPDTCIDPERQLAFYVSGIGTPAPGAPPSWRTRLGLGLDQAFGIGLEDKIAEAYVAIVSQWRPGDRIHLFGFSRGAYTVRRLAHVLELMDIPTTQTDGTSISLDPKHLFPIADEAVRILYRHGDVTTETHDSTRPRHRRQHRWQHRRLVARSSRLRRHRGRARVRLPRRRAER